MIAEGQIVLFKFPQTDQQEGKEIPLGSSFGNGA